MVHQSRLLFGYHLDMNKMRQCECGAYRLATKHIKQTKIEAQIMRKYKGNRKV